MSTMNGKVVLISGVGSGIGAHTARLFEAELLARSILEALS